MSLASTWLSRMKASVRPSGEKAGKKSSKGDILGAEVNFRSSPLSSESRNKLNGSAGEWCSETARKFPSGDQSIPTASVSANFRSGPPSAETTKMPPSGDLRLKAMRLPSGDQVGLESGAVLFVSRSGVPESINLT